MNLLKVALVLLFSGGFGFGVTQIIEEEPWNPDEHLGYCHGEDWDFDHVLDGLSEEEVDLVDARIDQLLLEYGVTMEELGDNHDLRHDFMSELFELLEQDGIELEPYDDDWHHHGMGSWHMR